MIVASEGVSIRDTVCAISDDLKHDAVAVKSFLNVLFAHIGFTYPHINKIHVWSDGASSQYKSKLPFLNISNAFGSNFGVVWNFFGSRHGKSAADGEAAVVKTFLANESAQTDLILDNAKQVYQHLSNSHLQILDGPSRRHFYFVAKPEIDAARKEQVVSLPTVPGTRKIHQMKQGSESDTISY